MTRISGRYVPHMTLLCLLAGVPTLLHSSGRFDVDDCADPRALMAPPSSRVRPATTQVNEKWLLRASPTREWSTGRIDLEGTGISLDTLIIRSHDPKTLFHKPELTLVEGLQSDVDGLEWLDHGSERLPIHRAYFDPALDTAVAAYMLVYRGRPVTNPYLAQVLAAPFQLVSGRGPMTLLFVSARVPAQQVERAEQQAREWLAASWERYRSACQP